MKSSFRIAYGGIVVGLSLVCMFFTGIFPFAEYALPALAGILLTVLVIEFGMKTALVAYLAVSLLSLVVTPNKEAALLFIFFLGYYPIIKAKLEKIKPFLIEWLVKLVTFNIAVTIAYFLIINVFGMSQVMEDFEFMKMGIWVLLGAGNIVFVVYDIAITNLIDMYNTHIKPKYLNKIKR